MRECSDRPTETCAMAYRQEEEMTFPVLKVQSIVNCLAELDIPITAAHIKEPLPAHLRGIYETIVETITGANLDSVRQNFQVRWRRRE